MPPCASVAWCFEVSLPHFTTPALLHEAGNSPQSQAISVSRSYPAALRADAVHVHGRQLFLIVQLGGRLAALALGVPRRRLRRLLGLLRLGLISACATSPICKPFDAAETTWWHQLHKAGRSWPALCLHCMLNILLSHDVRVLARQSNTSSDLTSLGLGRGGCELVRRICESQLLQARSVPCDAARA